VKAQWVLGIDVFDLIFRILIDDAGVVVAAAGGAQTLMF